MTTPLRVLIVEDSPDEAELIVLALESAGYVIINQRVDNAAAMQAALEQQPWDVVLCDYAMPEFDALRALQLLQARQLDLPFILVSGTVGEETAVAAMKAGIHDYVMKDKLARLAPAIERELKEATVRQERRSALEQLRYRAYYDPLTGLPNQTLLAEWIGECISRPDASFAVLHVDIDHYKTVKYGLGHVRAEELLLSISHRLKQTLRYNDVLARVAPDGFGILLREAGDQSEVERLIQQIHTAIADPFNLGGSVVTTSVNIGIIYSAIGYAQAEDFLRAADTAMHESWRQARGGTVVFDVGMQVRTQARLQMETDLRQAINQQQLFLNYQPIISLETGLPTGFEALVRWRHPAHGVVSPLEFIHLAEETRLIVSLGEWILQEACQQLGQVHIQRPSDPPLSMNVNLSGVQLETPDLLAQIDQSLASAGLLGSNLKVEITESVLMANAEQAIAVLNQLKTRSITVCIDDFGTGYSSLSYLRYLPINTLKIDKSFVSGLESDAKSLDIVRAIVTLAQALELDVVAEGVETVGQLAVLRSLGCQLAQGYLFSRPIDASNVVPWLREFTAQKAGELLDRACSENV